MQNKWIAIIAGLGISVSGLTVGVLKTDCLLDDVALQVTDRVICIPEQSEYDAIRDTLFAKIKNQGGVNLEEYQLYIAVMDHEARQNETVDLDYIPNP